MVGGVTEAPGQQGQATAEGVGDRAHARGRAGQGCQPGRCRLVDHLIPACSRGHPRGAGIGVHPDGAHPRGGDQHSALGGDGGRGMPGALHPHREPAFPRVRHCRLHVGGSGGAHHQVGTMPAGGLPTGAFLVVPLVAGREYRPHHLIGQPVHDSSFSPPSRVARNRPARSSAAAASADSSSSWNTCG